MGKIVMRDPDTGEEGPPIDRADVDRDEIARWQERIDPWITWAEVPELVTA